MIKYEIWQMPMNNLNKFMHYNWCKNSPQIRDYVMVYSGEKEFNSDKESFLEELFYIFNQEHPVDYHAASMSVSDVFCLIDESNQREWWYVDGIGFKRLDW
jgi:hypothetical protein